MSVEVVAGLDEAQVCAAFELHREWAREEGCDLDEEAWAGEMRGLCSSGRYNLWVAWDGDSPVGVTEAHLVYDSMKGEWVCYGERAYVLPKYRSSRVFDKIVRAGIDAMKFLDVHKFRAPAGVDLAGESLQSYYAAVGFKPAGVTMEMVL